VGGGAGIGARRLGRDPAHLLALLQADDSPAAFWAFADAWTPDPARANETCWGALGRSVHDLLPPSSARALQYALAARQASARVALTASLLDADGGAPDDGACCVAVLPGGVRVTDARDLARRVARLATHGIPSGDTPVALYEFDHVYRRAEGRPGVGIALYAPPGARCFAPMHATLSTAASDTSTPHRIDYALRPALPAPACADAGGCLALGAGGRVALPGFGAEFALKSTEYLAVDDSDKGKEEPKDKDAAAAADAPDEVAGFLFPTLRARTPPSSHPALDALRDRLLDDAARADDAPIKAWDLKDLGLQAAARALAAPDPLRALADGAASFPNAAPRLAKAPVPPAIRAAVVGAPGRVRRFQAGASMLALNGLLLDAATLELTDAVDALRHEARLADALATTGLDAGGVAGALRLRAVAGLDDGAAAAPPRVDLLSPAKAAIAWANDLETDDAYASWPDDIKAVLRPGFPGQLPSIALNLLNLVLVLDPCAPGAPALAAAAAVAVAARWPLRVGVLALPSAAVSRAAGAPPLPFAACGDCERVARALAAATAAGSPAGLAALGGLEEGKVSWAAFASALAAAPRRAADAEATIAAAASDAEAMRGAAAASAAASAGLAPAPGGGAALWLNGALLPPIAAAGGDAKRLLTWGLQTELQAAQGWIYFGEITQADADGVPEGHDGDDDDESDTDDGTHLLAKVLTVAGALPRHNPRATAKGAGDGAAGEAVVAAAAAAGLPPPPRQLRLQGALDPVSSPVLSTMAYATADTGPDVKAVTHWVAADASTPADRALARAALAALAAPPDPVKLTRAGAPAAPPPRATGARVALVQCGPPSAVSRLVLATTRAGLAAPRLRTVLAALLDESVAAGVTSDADAEAAARAAAGADAAAVVAALADAAGLDAALRAQAALCVAELGLAPGARALVSNGRILLDGTSAAAATTPPPPPLVAADLHLVEAHSDTGRLGALVAALVARRPAGARRPSDVAAAATALLLAAPPNPAASATARGAAALAAFDAEDAAGSPLLFEVGVAGGSPHSIALVVDPLSPVAQRIAPLLLSLRAGLAPASLRVLLNPVPDLTALPLSTFYAASLPTFKSAGEEVGGSGALPPLGEPLPPAASLTGLPAQKILTLNLHVPEGWLAEAVDAGRADLDNIVLAQLPGTALAARYELEALMITGSCVDAGATTRDGVTPRGVQLELVEEENGTGPGRRRVGDTLVMANLGYFQLQAPRPGVYSLALAAGRSTSLYTVDAASGPADGRGLGGRAGARRGETSLGVAVDTLNGRHLALRLRKRPGMEGEDVLAEGGGGGWRAWLPGGRSTAVAPPSLGPDGRPPAEDDPDCIHIFTVASGHMYERLQKIMALSVLAHTKHRVKFWFIKNYMSPSMRAVLPRLAAEKGFEYQFVTYKWPHWLHKQTEKQRVIWAYKILFLDVLFPLNLKKVIFVDSDQIVRADFGELWRMDLKGAPYAYTPFCEGNPDTEGFRFWKSGFWAGHLAGKPYHISALYVVDLARFRALAAGDRLRVTYDSLSRDPASLANLDQDLPNYAQHGVPIHSLPQEWLWCETWCGQGTKGAAKTIDLCNNPLTKEPKLDAARRIAPEWVGYDAEAGAATARAEVALAAERAGRGVEGVLEGGRGGGAKHDVTEL